MWRMLHGERGSMTVEAAIFIVVFIFIFININFIIRMARAHAVIQHGLTHTANEMAQYSYLLSAFGIKPYMDDISGTLGQKAEYSRDVLEAAEQLTEDVKQAHDSLDDLTSSSTGSALSSAQQFYEDAKNVSSSGGDMASKAGEIFSDPKSAMLSLAAMVLEDGYNALKTEAASWVARGLMERYISGEGMDGTARLEKLGVKNLSFKQSQLFADEDRENIDLIVTYDMEFPTPLTFFARMTFMQRAAVRAWL